MAHKIQSFQENTKPMFIKKFTYIFLCDFIMAFL